MINNSYTITLLDILALTPEFRHQEKVFDQVIGQTRKIPWHIHYMTNSLLM